MVEIRNLRPLVKIRMPKTSRPVMATRVTVVRRTNAEFPPPTPQPTPCRLWQGTQGSDGYGWRKVTMADGERKSVSMHRWVMSQLLGRPLERNEVVLHACDNPLCYRVSHLSIGTVASNNQDMRNKGRDSKPPVNRFQGECHPMAKLSAWQVRAIRGHRQSGLHIKTIAAMYDVAPSTIRRICSGASWAGESNNAPRPPTRDLLAEARATASEEARAAAPPPKRIRPVKHLELGDR